MPIFTVGNVAEVVEFLEKNIQAPYCKSYFSTLGGDENVGIIMKVSLDKRERWKNGYIENSRYFMFSIENNGKVKEFIGRPHMRRFNAKTVKEVTLKINKFLEMAKIGAEDMKLTKEDIDKFGTIEEKKILIEKKVNEEIDEKEKLTAFFDKNNFEYWWSYTGADYNDEVTENIDKFATEKEKKILKEGHMHQMEFAAAPDRVMGLRAHLESNFYSPIPRKVQERVISAFKKHWDGEWSVEDVVEDLTTDILRDDEAVFKYFGEFFNYDEGSGEEVWEQ